MRPLIQCVKDIARDFLGGNYKAPILPHAGRSTKWADFAKLGEDPRSGWGVARTDVYLARAAHAQPTSAKSAYGWNLGDQKGVAIKQCSQLLQIPDGDLAEAACEVLCWLDEDAAPPLVAVLASDDPDAQSRAARALMSIASRNRNWLSWISRLPHWRSCSAAASPSCPL